MEEKKYFLSLAQTGRLTNRRYHKIKSFFSSFEEAWREGQSAFLQCGFTAKEATEFVSAKDKIDPAREIDRMMRSGVDILSLDDNQYPLRLREIHSPPPFLFIKGQLQAKDDLSLAVVGTRILSDYGRRITREFATEIARHQITIVSGLALGADTLAHQAALSQGGRTVAIIGSGLHNIYPAENKNLAEKICQGRGALISEFPLSALPERQNFPIRNKTVSGISRGVLVTEAPAKSGALITAQIALEQNRDVFAVPGSIFSVKSSGANQIIRDLNAKLVTSAADVLSELQVNQKNSQSPEAKNLSSLEREIFYLLKNDSLHINEIVRQSQKNTQEVSYILSLLELKGYAQSAGMMWHKS